MMGRAAVQPAAWLQSLAALLWIPQAGVLAWAVQQLAAGAGIEAMWLPALGYLALGVLRASIEGAASRRLFAASRSGLSNLRRGAAQALASRSPLDCNRLPSGAAASVLAEQAEAILPWRLRYQPARLRSMLLPPVIALCVAWHSWLAALILVLAAPLIPIFMAVIGWRAKAASEEQLKVVGGMSGFLLDRLRGMSTLRALDAIDITATRVRSAAEQARASTMRVLRIAFLSSTALELFSALGVALVAVYVGFHLLGEVPGGSWGQRLSMAEGIFILMLAPAFFEPLRELAAVWHDKASGEAAQEALAALEQTPLALPAALAMAPAAPHDAQPPSVALMDVTFVHPGQAPLFEQINLTIGAGEHVALVGPSGIGKTTLLSLMAGLAPTASGQVRIGADVLDQDNAGALRARMAWIGQRPHVFAGSLHTNVALGRVAASTERVQQAIADAALGHVAQLAPGSSLGDGGQGLSGGEQVRLALARAACVPGIGLLLVDEPTAHLDRATADGVIDALLTLAQGRTLVVATHDPALAARMHRAVQVGELEPIRSAA